MKNIIRMEIQAIKRAEVKQWYVRSVIAILAKRKTERTGCITTGRGITHLGWDGGRRWTRQGWWTGSSLGSGNDFGADLLEFSSAVL